eukprot:Phypoly_transcript_15274.p1 GENE.Phypoly_transcript_15274~~Phypoly_transcript_15274.p1  ORF type:complete len:281 (+),score=37.75 Phypoly_transcript_15274:70-843(+)
MAKSKYEYVKNFESSDVLLPNVWIVVRIDGKAFTRFTTEHKYTKPNDDRGLGLMNACALSVMKEFSDIVVSYGESDEFSFVLRRKATLFQRRESKIITNIVSYFTSNFVFQWPQFFPSTPLLYPPTFDARAVCYPAPENLRDYLSWRQVDCHINNMYNTCFWALVGSGKTNVEAENILKGTLSDAKNEILFTQFGINYNTLSEMYKKGSIVVKQSVNETTKDSRTGEEVTRPKIRLVVLHEDLIRDKFWQDHPQILE